MYENYFFNSLNQESHQKRQSDSVMFIVCHPYENGETSLLKEANITHNIVKYRFPLAMYCITRLSTDSETDN